MVILEYVNDIIILKYFLIVQVIKRKLIHQFRKLKNKNLTLRILLDKFYSVKKEPNLSWINLQVFEQIANFSVKLLIFY